MLLIDALYVNNGGGKILLDILIDELYKCKIEAIYLLDKRVYGEYNFLDPKFVYFEKPSLVRRHLFYLKFKPVVSNVLAFGNIPPTVKLEVPVFVYFHNVLFLEKTKSFLMILKSFIIRYFNSRNTNWIVQSKLVKENLSSRWNISSKNISVIPIFNDKVSVRERNSNFDFIRFIYISDGYKHKNHFNLFEAFYLYNLHNPNCSLIVTLDDKFRKLKNSIKNFNDLGIKIVDLGLIPFDLVVQELVDSDIVIYPSLKESFGLGLIEAALLNKPICAADLPYVHEVVKPNLVFNPDSIESIYNTFNKANSILGLKSSLKVKNEIEKLVLTITQ